VWFALFIADMVSGVARMWLGIYTLGMLAKQKSELASEITLFKNTFDLGSCYG